MTDDKIRFPAADIFLFNRLDVDCSANVTAAVRASGNKETPNVTRNSVLCTDAVIFWVYIASVTDE